MCKTLAIILHVPSVRKGGWVIVKSDTAKRPHKITFMLVDLHKSSVWGLSFESSEILFLLTHIK